MKWLMSGYIVFLLIMAWVMNSHADVVSTAGNVGQSEVTQAVGLLLQLIFLVLGWIKAKGGK